MSREITDLIELMEPPLLQHKKAKKIEAKFIHDHL